MKDIINKLQSNRILVAAIIGIVTGIGYYFGFHEFVYELIQAGIAGGYIE